MCSHREDGREYITPLKVYIRTLSLKAQRGGANSDALWYTGSSDSEARQTKRRKEVSRSQPLRDA